MDDNNRVASSLHIDELVAVFDLQLQKDESIEELVKGCCPLLTTHHRTIYFVDPLSERLYQWVRSRYSLSCP